jgi:hypothetical protein
MKPNDRINILQQYSTDAGIVFGHPITFLRRLGVNGAQLFVRGATFSVLSVGVVFFLLIPAFWIQGRVLSPAMRELLGLFALIVLGFPVTGFLYHLSFKVFGGRGTLSETFGAYGFLVGALAPVHALLMYPTAIKFGPEFILLFPAIQEHAAGIEPSTENVMFLTLNIFVSGVVETPLTLLLGVPNFATVHAISNARSFFAIAAATLVAALASMS